MSYASQATTAKRIARDILRSQMAIRIQERVSKARAVYLATLRNLANVLEDHKLEDKRLATTDAETTARETFDMRRQILGALPVVTDEATLRELTAAIDESEAAAAEARKLADDAAEKRRADEIERATNQVEEAKKNLDHHLENLAKVESGELKVSKDDMLALANKLIEEGRVPADGTPSTDDEG